MSKTNTDITVVALLSGGMDSATLVAHLMAQGERPAALSVNYGQRHGRELEAARDLCTMWGIEHLVAQVDAPLAGSALVDPDVDVPMGHYEDATMRATVVPSRNLMFVAVGSAVAISRGAGAVALASHAGDHAVYPDCRPEFFEAAQQAVALGNYNGPEVWAPFVGMRKEDIAARGAELGVPFGLTWSCYVGGRVHCGTCGTCTERREAFQLAGVDDPTTYQQGGGQ